MTSPFTTLQVVKDTTGRTPKMLAGYRGQNIPGGPVPPSTPVSAGEGWRHKFFGSYGQLANMGPHGEAEEDVECEAVVVDNTKGTYATMQSHIVTPGAPDSELVVKWSDYNTISWSDFCKISMSTANPVKPKLTQPLLVPNASKIKKLLLKLVRRGGDNTLTPEMWNAIVEASSGVPATVPTGNDDPLPEGGVWGNKVFDINANSQAMKDLYGDGDDVNFWPDMAGGGFDMSTEATLLLPKYRTGAFGAGMPCVEWAGANVHLIHPDTQPTAPYGEWTYYFVFDGIDGGDVAALWGGGFGDSFQYVIVATADEYQAACNNLFGAPSLFVDNTGIANEPHIMRWTKWSSAASHGIFLNGDFAGSAGGAPQPNNQGFAQLMHHSGGLGLSGKVGRIVAYDTKHLHPTNTGGYTSGKTPIETALSATWGTP